MRTAAHLEKFQRIDATLGRLDVHEDPELWIWTAMSAGTHLLNAALHACGATEETDSFHTQGMGLYAVPVREHGGGFRDAMHAPGDVMHVGQPPISAPVPPSLSAACVALQVLENLREPYVRGSQPIPAGEAARWQSAYAQCIAGLQAALDQAGS